MSQSDSALTASVSSQLKLALGGVYNLLVSSASASTPVSVTFQVEDGSIGPSQLDRSYVVKTGDTMTGSLALPLNGLAVGTNQLVASGGKVGIGTATPTEKLHVMGALHGHLGDSGINSAPGLYLTNPDSSEGRAVSIDVGMGMGLTNVVAGGVINSAGNAYAYTGTRGASRLAMGDGEISLQVGSAVGVAGNPIAFVDGLHVISSGNVGIGTPTPVSPFTVSNSGAGRVVRIDSAGSASDTYIGIYNGEGNLKLGTDNNNSYVLGGGVAASSLTLKSTAGAGTTDYINFLVGNNGAVEAMRAVSSGNIGIGTPTPQFKLHVVGTICQDTDGDNACDGAVSSDARLKRNIVPIEHALEDLKKLTGVRFDWDNEVGPARHLGTRRQIGLIAQEVERVYPELIFRDREGYLMVDYQKLTAVLLEAVKEQQQAISKQREEISSMRAYLCAKDARASFCR